MDCGEPAHYGDCRGGPLYRIPQPECGVPATTVPAMHGTLASAEGAGHEFPAVADRGKRGRGALHGHTVPVVFDDDLFDASQLVCFDSDIDHSGVLVERVPRQLAQANAR